MALEVLAPAKTETEVDASTDRRAVGSWVIYDLANTLFSQNIVSLYFVLWVVNDMGGRDGNYLLANSTSMALIFLSAPLIGALSDQAPRRMPFLIVSTALCCLFTFILGIGGLWPSLVFFVIANYFFQAGLIFYDALLPTVSTEETRGRIGGLGIGVGYVGSLVGIGVGLTLLEVFGFEKPAVFKVSALLFMLFALPCFIWVPEKRRKDVAPFGWSAVRRAAIELRGTAVRVRRYSGLPRFLIGRIFYADVANTLIAVMAIYATQELGFTERTVQGIAIVGIVAGITGGLLWGRVVDRIGPKRTLDRVLGLWAVALTLTAIIAIADLPGWLFWFIAPLAGAALGGTWAADRPFMLRLSPPRHLGQFYGLYAMVGRFAAIIGPLLWTAIVDWLRLGRPAAVMSLLVLIIIAYSVLRPVDDTIRDWGPEDLVRT